MNNRVLFAALAGGIVHFLLGYVFYVQLFANFFKDNGGTASGVARAEPEMLFVALGSLVFGLLYALVYSMYTTITTFQGGAKAGAWIGFLSALGMALIGYGTTNMTTLPAVLVDGLIGAIMGALVGGAVGAVLGNKKIRKG